MPNTNIILPKPKEKKAVFFLILILRTRTKSHPVSQDKQKKYQCGSYEWETVSTTEQSDGYLFPILRTANEEIRELSFFFWSCSDF